MLLYLASIVFLIACWLVWVYPFIRQRNAGPKRESVVMAPASRWGIALESVAYGLVWFYLPPATLPGPIRLVASMIVGVISTVLVWWSIRHLGRQWRIQAGLYADHELVRTGPYAIVRHPIYTSMFGMLIATGLVLAPWVRFLIAIVVFIAGNEIRVRSEDKLLEARFGETFLSYRNKVAAFLPYVR
jgi:protein-S-isoprenylcysteine O-methyltransferase Ste14